MTLARLIRDRNGSTVIEFALLAPVFCLLLVGGFDVAHSLYLRSALQGVVQKTARDSGIEDSGNPADFAALDAKVTKQVKNLVNTASVTMTRRYYRTYAAAADAKAESFSDTNKNGTCDGPSGSTQGEPYQDANNNGRWDRDGGDAGQGGARDRVVYTVNVSYQRLFPFWRFVGLPATATTTASTVLANQPYADQNAYAAPTVRNCP